MDLEILAEAAGEALRRRSLMLTTAESCTGGWVAQVVTSIAGSSHWFDRGFVTYTNTAKQEMLGVQAKTLSDHGAVSSETVIEMAEGALKHSHAHVSVAVSGIAGPGGGSLYKPVGTVWTAWAGIGLPSRVEEKHFSGDREMIRRRAVENALTGIVKLLSE